MSPGTDLKDPTDGILLQVKAANVDSEGTSKLLAEKTAELERVLRQRDSSHQSLKERHAAAQLELAQRRDELARMQANGASYAAQLAALEAEVGATKGALSEVRAAVAQNRGLVTGHEERLQGLIIKEDAVLRKLRKQAGSIKALRAANEQQECTISEQAGKLEEAAGQLAARQEEVAALQRKAMLLQTNNDGHVKEKAILHQQLQRGNQLLQDMQKAGEEHRAALERMRKQLRAAQEQGAAKAAGQAHQGQELQAIRAQTAAVKAQQAGAASAAATAPVKAEADNMLTSQQHDTPVTSRAAKSACAGQAVAGSTDLMNKEQAHAEVALTCANDAKACSSMAGTDVSGHAGPAAADGRAEDTPDALEIDSSPNEVIPAARPPAKGTPAVSTGGPEASAKQQDSAAAAEVHHAQSMPQDKLGRGSASRPESRVTGANAAPVTSRVVAGGNKVAPAAEVQTGADAAASADAAESPAHDIFASFAAFQDLPAGADRQESIDKKRKRDAGAA